MPHKTATTRKKTTTTKKRTTKTTTHAKSTKTAKVTPKKTVKKSSSPRKYGPLAQKEVKMEMIKYKKGTAKSGRSGLPVKSRKQAIAIALSEARAKGAKVPKKRS